MIMGRDDFPRNVRLTLAIRAAHFCSNPECIKLTAGPHSDENKSLSTGHAAHIHAASPGGPRYLARQSPEQRKRASNGIWLCRVCGDLVDKDPSQYTVKTLRGWKRTHEALIAEVRTKGYSRSLELLRHDQSDGATAIKLVRLLEDKRALWAAVDAEFPDRVRRSLDQLRADLTTLRITLPRQAPMDAIILSLTRTIHLFFDRVEKYDLVRLQCDSRDPAWLDFRNALGSLRKSIGLQISNLAIAHTLSIGPDLQRILPE